MTRAAADQFGDSVRFGGTATVPYRIVPAAPADEGIALAEQIFAHSEEAIVVIDPQGHIERVNAAYTRITGYTGSEVCGRRPQLILDHRHDRSFYAGMWRQLQRRGNWRGEIYGCRKGAASCPLSLNLVTVRDAAGDVQHYLAIASDLSRRKHDEALIEQLRNFDPLTGLPSWEALLQHLHATLLAAQSGGQVGVLLLGLDRFTHINDTLGHGFGDYIVAAMAERLQRCAGADNTVARRGGDEFCIVLRQPAATEAAAELAKRLLAAVAEPLAILGQDYVLTASVGTALFPADGDHATALIGHAGAAMQQARQDGGNAFRCYHGELDIAMLERLTIDQEMRLAIEQQQFVLQYQPQVGIASGQVVGFEALIRWQHPQLGMIAPTRFIPLAEETGQIVAIGEWVLREACRQARGWHDAGHTGLQMAVNLSPRQFAHAGLERQVEAALADSGLAPQYLELEITESALMDDPQAAAALLQRLKQRGVRIAVDDFGTGYSSLGYLKRFPLDRLKIDRSFVRDCCLEHQDATIVNAVISLAHALGLDVVAEGVENPAQLDFLQRHGCGFAQGYLFGRPVGAGETTALLAEGHDLLKKMENRGETLAVALVGKEKPHDDLSDQ